MLNDNELARLAQRHQRALTDGDIFTYFVKPREDLAIEDARTIVTNLIYDDLVDERDRILVHILDAEYEEGFWGD